MSLFLGSNKVAPTMYGGIVPSGTLSITSNGMYDVGSYASASVNVSGGGGDLFEQLVDRTITEASGQCTKVGDYAFYYCTSLTTASFPSATSIGNSAFYFCTSLTTASFPLVTSIGSYAFAYCSNLTTVDFPSATSIGSYAFGRCSNLTTISFPSATIISNYAFYYCTSLTTASFPNATSIGTYAFAACSRLTTASFPLVTSIGTYAFASCSTLLSFYLMGSSVPSLASTTAFNFTPISNYTTSTGGVYGSIYVPASLYSSYLTATNWSVYSSRFVSVS